MSTELDDRPFTRQVPALTDRVTYERIAQRVGYARSTGWLDHSERVTGPAARLDKRLVPAR